MLVISVSIDRGSIPWTVSALSTGREDAWFGVGDGYLPLRLPDFRVVNAWFGAMDRDLLQILVWKQFDLFRIQFGVVAYWLDQGSGLKGPLVPKRCTLYSFFGN